MTVATTSILLISGSTRGASTNTALLRTAQAIAPAGVTATLFAGMTDLPHFNPDDDPADEAALAAHPLHPAVVRLRAAIGAADAVLFCTPEYAGALPGSFKNLLDWCVGGGELYEKPVAWINVSSSGTGARDAHASLERVLGYLTVHVVAACTPIPITRGQVGADGLIADTAVRERITEVLAALAQHVAGTARR